MRIKFIARATALILVALPLLAQQPAQKGPHPKSQKELEALQKVQTAQTAKDIDGELAAINYVLENFTDTDFKMQLLNMGMGAAEQKNDPVLIVTWGERILQADPNDIPSRIMMAEVTAQRTRENDLDKAQSIQKINDYAHKALDLLKTATAPPPGLPDAQWPEYKKELTSQAHDALGQADALDKKYEDAITEYKTALDANPSALTTARLAKVYVDNKQYDDAIGAADKVLAMNDAPPSVKSFAQAQKDAATKLKSAK